MSKRRNIVGMNLYVRNYKYMFFKFYHSEVLSVFPIGAVSLTLICFLCTPGHSFLTKIGTLQNCFQGPLLLLLLFLDSKPAIVRSGCGGLTVR